MKKKKKQLRLKHIEDKAAFIILHVRFLQWRHSSNSIIAIRQSLAPLSPPPSGCV